MPFGPDPFGAGAFGHADWVDRVVWKTIPFAHRQEDDVQGGPLRRFLATWQEELEAQERLIRELPLQRDPLLARADEVVEAFEIASLTLTTKTGYGSVIEAVGSPGEQIEGIGPGWVMVLGDRTFTVVAVRGREDVQRIWFRENAIPAGVVFPISADFYAPSLLERLARDFGVELDENEPEFYQRSTIKGIVQYLGWKGANKAYEIRGVVAGMDVRVRGLYRISEDFVAGLPAGRVFVMNVGGYERTYTDLDPLALHWDDFATDALPDIPLDPMSSDMDEIYLYEDSGLPGGLSVAALMSDCMFEVDITSVVDLSPAELTALGLTSGKKLIGEMDPLHFILFGWVPGTWSFTSDATGQLYADAMITPSSLPLVPPYASPLPVEFAVGVAPGSVIPTGTYCVDYTPGVAYSCDWCRSHVIRVEITPKDDLIASLGTPAAVSRAIDRLIDKFKAIIPIHVRVGEYVRVTETIVPFPTPFVYEV